MDRSTNYNFYLPGNGDYRDISVISSNFDVIDAQLHNTNNTVAVHAIGNTAPRAIAKDQYVIWGGNLYTAKGAIANGGTLSASNLNSIVGGGLNSILGIISTNQSDFSDFKSMLNYNKGGYSIASKSALDTTMDAVRATIATGETIHFYINITTEFDPFTARAYYVELRQLGDSQSTNYCTATFRANSNNDEIQALRNNNGWTYNKDCLVQSITYQKYVADTTSVTSRTYNIPSSSRFFIVGLAGSQGNMFATLLCCTTTGSIGRVNLALGANVTIDTSTVNTLTVTFANATTNPLLVFTLSKTSLDNFYRIS